MTCTCLARRARGWPVVVAALVLLALAVPSSASANIDYRRSSSPAVERAGRDGSAALLRSGSGYARPDGSVRVRGLQRRLRRLGFAPGPVDGRFGPRTERAVMRFQVAHGVPSDGIVGAVTSAQLRRAWFVVGPGAGVARRGGSRRVRWIQQRLRRLGFAPGPVDGRFGWRTERAVVRFQARRRLAVDGLVGPHTRARL